MNDFQVPSESATGEPLPASKHDLDRSDGGLALSLEHAGKVHDEDDSGLSNNSTSPSSVGCTSGQQSPTTNSLSASINIEELKLKESPVEDDFISFTLPSLHSKPRKEQLDFLLLAWALLVFRNSEVGSEAAFAWSFSKPVEIDGRYHKTLSGESGISLVAKILDEIRQNDTSSGSQAGLGDAEHIFLDTIDTVEHNSNWSFSLDADISNNTLRVRQTKSPAAVPQNMAVAHINAFVDILESVLSKEDQSIAEAVQVGQRELTQVWQWNSVVPPTIDRCMHDIISDVAKAAPDRIAVTSWDGELTYGGLEDLSTRLAIRLAGLGVTVGVTVPMCFEKSMWTAVGLLAVMKAGGTFVLTDPHQPEARLQIIAQEVEAKIVLTSITQADLGSRIAPLGAQIVSIGPDDFDNNDEMPSNSLPQVPTSAILYIIFTSGSTGKPKGVIISHASYTSGAIPRADAVGYRPHSRVLDFASYAFDVSIDCMLATLSQGGCICVPSDEARVNDLSGAIRGMNVNMAHMTPSVARVLETDVGVMESLEVLGLGGELVSAGDATSFGQKTKLIIAYGPSECTVGCTINNDVGVGRPYTTIGKGVGGVTWIVDPDDHNILMPIGGVGELLIEGPVVGQGYLHDAQNTSSVFIEDPTWLAKGAGDVPGRHGRLYKTGDLVTYSPDGCGFLVFVGRKDRQVKLRGQRVELAEIEHHLRRILPGGTSVAVEVITPGSKSGPQTLVAFLAEQKEKNVEGSTPKEPSSTNGEGASFSPALQKILADMDKSLAVNLPVYMIPTAYIPLQAMPLLVSCKTDRKKLQELGLGMSLQQLSKFRVEAGEKQEPRTDMERNIHNLWAQLFGSDMDIGVNDNFFSLGGDSLKAMKLVADARAAGLSLTVADIFMHPTLAGMALTASVAGTDAPQEIPAFSLIDTKWSADTARSEAAKLCNVDILSVEDVLPCTPLQEGLMALSAKVSEAYIAQRVVELADLPTAHKLQAAFDLVVADCPIMRTRIVQVPSHGLMQVVSNDKIPWNLGTSLDDYLAQDRGITMNLGESLARFAVIGEEGANKAYLVLTIHHALYDGWSMPLIVDRINRAYRGEKTETPTPFKAFIKYLSGADTISSASYWREQLDGATKPQFPPLPQPGYQQQADSLLELNVPFAKASTSSTTIATAIRGAWAIVAAQYTASNDVVFGETLTGRNAPVVGVENIEGPMITTVPVRVRINPEASIAEFLQDIHEQTVSRMPHEHMGLQHIRRLSPDAREACELRMGLVLHPNAEEDTLSTSMIDAPANGFVPAGDEDAAREAVKFNSYGLMLVCSLGPDGVLIMASFDSKMVEVSHMNRVLEQLGRTLQRLCGDTNGTIRDITLLTEEEQAQLWRFSNSGPLSVKATDKSAMGEVVSRATGTWIVDPLDPARLLPLHAIGELLVETTDVADLPSIDAPHWLTEGCKGFPGRQTRLHPTGKLCKYDKHGSIVYMGSKDEQTAKTSESRPRNVPAKVQLVMTQRQHELAQLWSRVLGISKADIGPNDSFFDLGGDSIGAMKLVSEARMADIKLTMAQIFKHKRLNDMASILEDSQPSKVAPVSSEPFSALDVSDIDALVSMSIVPNLAQPGWKVVNVLPTRPLQEVAVKGTFKLPRYSARYELFYFDTPVDKTRLFRSCQELVARNEILRTVFVESMERCFGVVLEKLIAPVDEYEIEGDIETFSHKLCDLDVQTRMPLGSSFVKFLFVQGHDGRSALIFRISHAQYDEICLPVMLHQLSALYEGRPLANTVPFSSFINHVVKVSIPQSFDYWRNLLKGSSMSILRPDVPLESKTAAGVSRTFDISARSKNITVATIPTAAWALCLARALSTRDVTFGEVVSGRNIDLANCDAVMGPCWQYVPVRVKFEDNWTALDLLNFVQNQHITSSPFESVGLKEIVENCTEWPKTVDWFDTVVHQDVDHVETLPFTSASSRMETIYPHLEPLREWKFQAFVKGDSLTFEIVTFEAWIPRAEALLNDLDEIMAKLMLKLDSPAFD